MMEHAQTGALLCCKFVVLFLEVNTYNYSLKRLTSQTILYANQEIYTTAHFHSKNQHELFYFNRKYYWVTLIEQNCNKVYYLVEI